MLLCLLLLFMLFVLGAVLDGTLFNTAVRTKTTKSSITLRANALSWTAVDSEAIYQAGGPWVYIQRCGWNTLTDRLIRVPHAGDAVITRRRDTALGHR